MNPKPCWGKLNNVGLCNLCHSKQELLPYPIEFETHALRLHIRANS